MIHNCENGTSLCFQHCSISTYFTVLWCETVWNSVNDQPRSQQCFTEGLLTLSVCVLMPGWLCSCMNYAESWWAAALTTSGEECWWRGDCLIWWKNRNKRNVGLRERKREGGGGGRGDLARGGNKGSLYVGQWNGEYREGEQRGEREGKSGEGGWSDMEREQWLSSFQCSSSSRNLLQCTVLHHRISGQRPHSHCRMTSLTTEWEGEGGCLTSLSFCQSVCLSLWVPLGGLWSYNSWVILSPVPASAFLWRTIFFSSLNVSGLQTVCKMVDYW